MTRRMIISLVFHGVLLVFLGMLVGLPFRRAITANWSPDAERAWRVAHTSLVTSGTLYIALAAVAQHLVLGSRAARCVSGSLTLAAYIFAVAFVVGPAVGARGLEPVGSPLHVTIFVGFVVGILLLLLATGVVLWGAYAALRSSRSD